MHYYTFNIGDYRRDTAHLSLLEHGIYRQLIDTYYLSESPLCVDESTLMRTHCIRTEEEIKAFRSVLHDFFQLTDDGWFHKGCEKNIDSYRQKSDKARNSAKARWVKDANAMRTQSERNANGMLTNNHKPITNNQYKRKELNAPEGVSESVWLSFLDQRKKARAVVNETVLKMIQKEATKANMTLEHAMEEMVARGWRGFKADWVTKDNKRTEHQIRQDATAKAIFGNLTKTIDMEVVNEKLITS